MTRIAGATMTKIAYKFTHVVKSVWCKFFRTFFLNMAGVGYKEKYFKLPLVTQMVKGYNQDGIILFLITKGC